MSETFLQEALKGSHPCGSEIRLTQIFSACFNESEVFRHSVGEFLGCDLRTAESKTQQSYKSKTRAAFIDIQLQNNHQKPLVVIENKIDAELTYDHPRKYNSIPEIADCKKFCFVKRYYRASADEKGWEIKYWREFYLQLLRDEREPNDFATANFISILKDYGMDSPLEIKQTKLAELADALHKLRSDKPNFLIDGEAFETMVDLKKNAGGFVQTSGQRRENSGQGRQVFLAKDVLYALVGPEKERKTAAIDVLRSVAEKASERCEEPACRAPTLRQT